MISFWLSEGQNKRSSAFKEKKRKAFQAGENYPQTPTSSLHSPPPQLVTCLKLMNLAKMRVSGSVEEVLRPLRLQN